MSTPLRIANALVAALILVLSIVFVSMPPASSPARSGVLNAALVLFFVLQVLPAPRGSR